MRATRFLFALVVTLALFAVCSSGAFAVDTVTSSNIENYIKNAKTANDHEAIAVYYEGEAARAAEAAKAYGVQSDCYHKESAARQTAGEHYPGYRASKHCSLMARHYLEIEAEAKKLAELHHQIAKDMQAGPTAAK